jgi:outer membrane biosynthesis protein TonB
VTASAESRPAPARAESSGITSLFASSDNRSEGVFGRIGRWFGGDDEKPVPSAPTAVAAKTPAPKPAPRPHATPKQPAQPAQPAQQTAEPVQAAQAAAPAPTPARQSAASGASLMSGATPTVPSGNFDNRWGAIR